MKSEGSVVLVKIGGSLITDKSRPYTLRSQALRKIAEEVKKALQTGKRIVLGHGAGSFAHVPAKKYRTIEGVINKSSVRGLVEVAATAAELNRIVVKELIAVGVEAVSVSPMAMMGSRGQELEEMRVGAIEGLLELGVLPVVYGDVVMDDSQGFTIFSTERVLSYIGLELMERGWEVEKVIHCGKTNGVLDGKGNTIEVINDKNFGKWASVLTGASGVDVTGGMLHKVEESLSLARQGIPGLIIDGIEKGSLSQAIRGEEVVGTRIESSRQAESRKKAEKKPNHVAIIMDGNRRWARLKHKSVLQGHKKVVNERIEELIEAAVKENIAYLTLWAFSTENWKRDENEVKGIMKLFRWALEKKAKKLIKQGARVRFIGDLKAFPQDVAEGFEKLMKDTEENRRITVTFALNYGGRDEIVRAARGTLEEILRLSGSSHRSRVAQDDNDALESLASLSNGELESVLESKMDTVGMPDPDMIIRTSGEQRLSGFMPWQGVYAELYFTKTLMPDFGAKEFIKAVGEFGKRERRFGEG